MYPTRLLLFRRTSSSAQAVAQQQHHRTPLIKFLGKRESPNAPSPSTPSPPEIHPASPSSSLPDSFVQYRSKAQQHGPLGHRASSSSSSMLSSSSNPSSFSRTTAGEATATGAIGGRSGHSLGSVEPPPGQFFDRSELPARFRRTVWTEDEIEAVGSGGASVVF